MIERVTTPRGEFQLQRRGEACEVICNGCFLIATYNGRSERALVELARGLAPGSRRVLVGGLGAGYTLRAALDAPGVEQVTVVEIEPVVAEWNRTHLASCNGHALRDPRTRLVLADLFDYLGGEGRPGWEPDPYDLIAVDTDNGPDWVVFDRNRALWGRRGLELVASRLAPGGVAAFWSAHASQTFEALLMERFARVETHPVQAAVSPVDDVVYLATEKR